jgi:hypothetical protein
LIANQQANQPGIENFMKVNEEMISGAMIKGL